MKKARKPIKRFKEFCEGSGLNEGVVRSGSILIAANKARRSGDDAQNAFEAGHRSLRKTVPQDDIDARLNQLRDAIGSLFTGMVHMRLQAGSHLAADVAGHLIAAQAVAPPKRR